MGCEERRHERRNVCHRRSINYRFTDACLSASTLAVDVVDSEIRQSN